MGGTPNQRTEAFSFAKEKGGVFLLELYPLYSRKLPSVPPSPSYRLEAPASDRSTYLVLVAPVVER